MPKRSAFTPNSASAPLAPPLNRITSSVLIFRPFLNSQWFLETLHGRRETLGSGLSGHDESVVASCPAVIAGTGIVIHPGMLRAWRNFTDRKRFSKAHGLFAAFRFRLIRSKGAFFPTCGTFVFNAIFHGWLLSGYLFSFFPA
jgi:hypothetical protein